MPPFNNKSRLDVDPMVDQINIPVFGLISHEAMSIFESEDVARSAAKIGWEIPAWGIPPIMVTKMPKIMDLIKEAKRLPDLSENDKAATVKLENFVKAFKALDQSTLKNFQDWENFVTQHVNPGWEGRLHFDHLLGNFGFDRQTADKLRKMELEDKDGKMVSYEQHAFRWLGKSLSAFGPTGCMTDVVNMIYAMMQATPTASREEGDIKKQISDFKEKLRNCDFSGLWLPSHYVMDAETDDIFCWVLLDYIHSCRGSRFKMLVQLPTDKLFDGVAEKFGALELCTVFRDPEAKNSEAIKHAFGIG